MTAHFRPIVLLTDFGLQDPYAGVVKGVILGIHPRAQIIDLTHGIEPQNVPQASFFLSSACRYFPEGTIFVAVVDPGVGTDRALLAVEADRRVFLAPDNGLLGFLEETGAVRRRIRIENSKYFLKPISRTFHGRDILAPVAAHLSRGLPLGKLGPAVARIKTLISRGAGHVVSIDRFGNLITDIPIDRVGGAVRIGRATIPRLSRTYADGKNGDLLALAGSAGTLEIAVNRGSARERTRARIGDPVRLLPSKR